MSTESELTDEQILEEANRLASPEEREAWLKAAVGIDDSLQERAEQLLAAGGSPGSAADRTAITPSLPAGLTPQRAEEAGQRLGHYTLLEQIGAGGFGTVWKARQEEPVRRTVALKIIKPGMDTVEVLGRFEQERQALAMMDHPGIAKVFDAGATAAGRPFFVMELIAGIPVTQFCDEHRLRTGERLQLILDVCSAVQHAHQKGIIHRDLKPSNILVTSPGERPEIRVIDFGIAKAIAPETSGGTIRTQLDQFIGTPAYMSPEQACLDGQDVDTRADIYALGVLLYQLLTGTTPLESRTSQKASLDEIRRIIRDEEPSPPSTAVGRLKGDLLTRVLKTRKTALRELSLLLRRDMDWIVMKALEKDRNRRYETANALAMDIRRYLNGEPVQARPPSFSYRAGKFIRRRKGPVLAAAAVLVTLVGGLAASTTMYVREKAALSSESAARRKAETEAKKNAQMATFLNEMLAGISPDEAKGADPTLMKKILAKAAARAGRDLQGQPEVETFLRNTIGSTYFTIGLFAEAKTQYEAGLKTARDALQETDRLTLRLRGNLANILHAEGNYKEAEAENRAILQIRLREYPPDDIEALATRDNLATEISKQGRYEDAAEEYLSLLPLQQNAIGKDHPDTLRTRMALANVMSRLASGDMAKLVEVEKNYREIIAIAEGNPLMGKHHTQTLEARYGLADVLYFLTKYGDAEQEHREVCELRKNVLSKTHKKVFQSRAGIARAIAGQEGRLDEAITELRTILQEQKAAPQYDKGDYLNNEAALKLFEDALRNEKH